MQVKSDCSIQTNYLLVPKVIKISDEESLFAWRQFGHTKLLQDFVTRAMIMYKNKAFWSRKTWMEPWQKKRCIRRKTKCFDQRKFLHGLAIIKQCRIISHDANEVRKIMLNSFTLKQCWRFSQLDIGQWSRSRIDNKKFLESYLEPFLTKKS